MEQRTESRPAADPSAPRQRVERQLAALRNATGWLLAELERHGIAGQETGPASGARLRAAVRGLNWTSKEHERLHRLADELDELDAAAEAAAAGDPGADALAALALRLERSACDALALYAAVQAEAAQDASRLAAALPDEGDEAARRQALAGWGARVRARLDADPGVVKVPVGGLELYQARRFVDAETCAVLIASIERDLFPSAVLGSHPDPEFRTSKSCNLSPLDAAVDLVDRRLAALLGIDRRFSETVQGQRYQVGQQFKPHHDFFHKGESYYEDASRQGGQRTWTAMLFLNEPERGGATNFPQVRVSAAPETGTALIWNNMHADGTPNPNSLHQGSPVEAGLKYVITKWFRERPRV